jgi:hypothetical protein
VITRAARETSVEADHCGYVQGRPVSRADAVIVHLRKITAIHPRNAGPIHPLSKMTFLKNPLCAKLLTRVEV